MTALLLALCLVMPALSAQADSEASRSPAIPDTKTHYQLHPIGWILKRDGRTVIEIQPEYHSALLGVDQLDSLWVLYWFDRNDTPEQRAILQVHPHGNPDNPLRGVFATRAPMQPNLIAMSRCRVLGVEGTVIEIDDIDAFADTPVLDLKP